MAFYFFLFLLLFCPLAFGTGDLWALAVMEIVCYGAAFFYFIVSWKRRVIHQIPGAVPLLLCLGFILFQIVPLPSGLVRVLSPATYDLYNNSIGIVSPPVWMSLSLNRASTLAEFFRYGAYSSFYFVGIQLLTDHQRLKKTTRLVVILCGFICVQAILQKYLDNGRMFWLRPPPPGVDSFIGPYAYRNFFAGYVGMVAPLAIALFFYYRPSSAYGSSFRQRLVAVFNAPHFTTWLWLGFGILIMASAVVVSMSRGGMISFALSGGVLLLFFVSRGRGKKGYVTFFLGLVLALVFAVSWFGADKLDHRFGQMFNYAGEFIERRPQIWQDSLGIIDDFPLFGTGVGTFGNIFPTYRTIPEGRFFYNAHNDYIQTVVDGGVVYLLLIGGFLITVFRHVIKKIRRRRDSYAVYLTFGSLAGALAIFIHSITDFNFQNGANGLYFFFILALAVSFSHSRASSRLPTMLSVEQGGLASLKFVFVTGMLLMGGLVFNFSSLWSQSQITELGHLGRADKTPQPVLEERMTTLSDLLRYSPLNSVIRFRLAQTFELLDLPQEAELQYRDAIRLNPSQATYLQAYGLFLADHGKRDEADKFLRASIKHDKTGSDRRREYAYFLFNDPDRQKGLDVMSDVLAMDQARNSRDILYLVYEGYSEDDIRRILPARVLPWLAFAAYLDNKGETVKAESVYRTALTHIDREEDIKADYYYKVSGFFNKMKKYDDALNVILQGIEALPRHVGLHITAGDLYKRLGVSYRAIELYRNAVTLEPGNAMAVQKLRELSVTLQ